MARPSFPITGYCALSALGVQSEEVVRRLRSTESGLAPSTFDLPFPTAIGQVTQSGLRLPDHQNAADSRSARLLYANLQQGLPQLTTAIARYDATRIGVLVGSSTGGISASETASAEYFRSGTPGARYRYESQHVFDALSRLLAEEIGALGPQLVVSTACSSSGKALASASRWLAAGIADAVLVAGVDSLCQLTLRGFHSLGILARTPCAPFTQEPNGISIGEGSALMLLERDAPARIHLQGAGESSDAHHMTAPQPEGLGAHAAMAQAMSAAGIAAEQVDYINAHGTGTSLNDAAESAAIVRLFGERVPVSSTKDRTGHLLGAAGAVEAVFSAYSLEHRFLIGQCTSRVPAPGIQANVVSRSRPAAPERVLSNSCAFGGSNVSVLLGTQSTQGAVAPSPLEHIFVKSAMLWAPGIDSVQAWCTNCHSAEREPNAQVLKPRMRGRASLLTKMFAHLVADLRKAAPTTSATLPMVYGSANGELTTTLKLLEMLTHDDGQISPARFQGSVHNTAAGLISIAEGNTAFSTAIAAGDNTFGMGLLEASAWLTQAGGEMFLLLADEPVPEWLSGRKPYAPLALGLHLSSRLDPDHNLGRISNLKQDAGCTPLRAREAEALATNSSWRNLSANPCAGGLPLLTALSERRSGDVTLSRSEKSAWTARIDFVEDKRS